MLPKGRLMHTSYMLTSPTNIIRYDGCLESKLQSAVNKTSNGEKLIIILKKYVHI
jgi:hypothetical protein